MMQIDNVDALRHSLAAKRQDGQTIAFVPTMGNLHEGHLRLVDQAKQLADVVVTSIFVNPLQFGAGEDFDRYPRTLERDAAALDQHANDIVFCPSVEEVYPIPLAEMTRINVPSLSDVLCGQYRSGHFDGVCTVVAKLFNMVQPHVAVFGEKDYQQLVIIKRMVADLNMAIRVHGCVTQRERDGLAMSSRNQYLSTSERAVAPALYQQLVQLRQRALSDGAVNYQILTDLGKAQLTALGFQPQYLEFRDAEHLKPAQAGQPNTRLFVAAFLGQTRLIDNISI